MFKIVVNQYSEHMALGLKTYHTSPYVNLGFKPFKLVQK